MASKQNWPMNCTCGMEGHDVTQVDCPAYEREADVIALQTALAAANARITEAERQRDDNLGQLIGWRTAENIAIKECMALRKELQQANARAEAADMLLRRLHDALTEGIDELRDSELRQSQPDCQPRGSRQVSDEGSAGQR